jgi:hypothetical protein
MDSPSPSYIMLFGRYAIAIWEDGIAAMGAGLGILLGFLAAYFAFIAGHNIAFLWLLALLSFVFAGYRVWLKEHKAHLAIIEESTKNLFTFRVDEKRSLAYVSQEAGGITVIQFAVIMQFIKHGTNPATMEDIEPGFYEMLTNTSDCQEISTFIFGEPVFQLLSTSENQEFRGRRFDPGVSPWYRFGAWLEIIGGDLKPSDLNVKHSLRITMTAINQAPLSASLYFDWSKASEKPTSCFPVWPRSLAAPRRDRIMTYDKGDELKKLSEGFVLVAPASDKPD